MTPSLNLLITRGSLEMSLNFKPLISFSELTIRCLITTNNLSCYSNLFQQNYYVASQIFFFPTHILWFQNLVVSVSSCLNIRIWQKYIYEKEKTKTIILNHYVTISLILFRLLCLSIKKTRVSLDDFLSSYCD